MALFTTLALAETRCRLKVADGTWIAAFACVATLESAGKPVFAVRVQRKMSATHPDYGAWTDITQDNQT